MASVTITVRVQPRAKREELVGIREGVLVVRVAAPALEGRANDALRRLLADRLGIRAAAVTIIRGAHSREKVVRIDDVEEGVVRAALGL